LSICIDDPQISERRERKRKRKNRYTKLLGLDDINGGNKGRE